MAIELAAAKSHRPLVMRLLFVTDPAARLCGLGCDVDTAPMQARLNVAPWLRVLSAAEECSGNKGQLQSCQYPLRNAGSISAKA